MFTLSCVAAYKITGDEFSRETALLAARKLASRFRDKAGIIQVRGRLDDMENEALGEFIIDCCMNLPLLYWAARETGDRSFSDKAYSHIKNVQKYMVRPDASTYQNFRKDIATGAPIGGWIAQGDSHDGACWSRGQAWAMYGLPLSYNYTGDATLLETCKAVSNYFLNRLQSDLVPNWDFYYKTDEDQRDTSASAVAACGLLELARNLPVTDSDREVYEAAAKTLIYALIKNYLYCDGESPNAILKSGVYAMRTNLCVDEPVIWGDYFFMEALQRLTHYYRSFW